MPQGDEDEVTPQMHAETIKKRLAASDVADKAEFRKRQKETKLALKIKLKKMLSAKDSEDEDAGPTRLGGGDDASSDDDQSGSERGGGDMGEEEEEEEDTRRKGKSAKGRGAAVGGKGDKKRRRNDDGESGGVGSYDLQAQEDMALQMIMKRRK